MLPGDQIDGAARCGVLDIVRVFAGAAIDRNVVPCITPRILNVWLPVPPSIVAKATGGALEISAISDLACRPRRFDRIDLVTKRHGTAGDRRCGKSPRVVGLVIAVVDGQGSR